MLMSNTEEGNCVDTCNFKAHADINKQKDKANDKDDTENDNQLQDCANEDAPKDDDDDEDDEHEADETKMAESPLLPIQEENQIENNNNTDSISHISPRHRFSSLTNFTNPNQLFTAIPSQVNKEKRFSFQNIFSPSPTKREGKRRGSVPFISKFDGIFSTRRASGQGKRGSETDETTLTTGSDTSTNFHFFKDRNFYSQTATPTHTHHYNLYPQDSFASLEGKAPKFSTKMQTKIDAVGRVTGEWGKWQLRTVLLIFLCKIPSSWFMACIIFTAPAPRHGEFFCKPPPTVGAQNQTQWIKISHPQKEELDDQEFSIDFCNIYQDAQEHAHHYYQYEDKELEPKVWVEPESKNANLIPCREFQHEAEFESVITQYDLVCSRDILVSVTQFFHLFGVLTGGILANHLLKHFSPRNVMLFGMVTQIFCGNLTGHVASYELHVFFRCLSAVCCAQMYTAGGMIMSDITGGKYKTCVSTLYEQFWSIGVILLPGVASFFESWTHLYMAISWPTVILIYLWRWIPDSPRWMIARGRVMDAKNILLECVEINGTRFSLPHDIDQQLELQAQTAMDAPPPAGWWSIWKGEKAIKHMICVHLAWSIYIVVYYGMLLNIRSFSREHLEVNTAVAGASEIIGTFIGLYLILKTTRKWLWTGLFNVIAGLIAYSGWLVPRNLQFETRVALLMLTAMVSKVAISCTLAILTTCTVELVSDDKKKVASFSTICWARFWLLGAPFIGATVVFGQLIPQTAFASLAIIGGVLTALISSPRTISKPLKTTTAQNMAQSTQFTNLDTNGYDNKAYHQGPIFTSFKQVHLNSHKNLPPQLVHGIWTTKNPEVNNPPV